MDNLQYLFISNRYFFKSCFKPYYKWITFNTLVNNSRKRRMINMSFKPYYKWITFNTVYKLIHRIFNNSFKPYYKWITFNTQIE